MKKAGGILLLLAFFALDFLPAFADEQRSTEYISPYGDYRELTSLRSLQIGEATNALGSMTVYGDCRVEGGAAQVDEVLGIDGNTLHTVHNPGWGGAFWTGINVAVPDAEFHVNGTVFARRFRTSPIGAAFADQQLYFGVNAGKSEGEMGSRVPAGWNDPDSIVRFHGIPVVLNHYARITHPTTRVIIGTGQTVGSIPALVQVGDTTRRLNIKGWPLSTFSSREFKKDIAPLSLTQSQALYDRFNRFNLVTFRFKNHPDPEPQLGLIVEEAPEELLSEGGGGVSLSDSTGVLLAVIQNLKTENDDLEKQITALEKRFGVGGRVV